MFGAFPESVEKIDAAEHRFKITFRVREVPGMGQYVIVPTPLYVNVITMVFPSGNVVTGSDVGA